MNRVSFREKVVGSKESKFFLSILPNLKNSKQFGPALGPEEQSACRVYLFLSLRATDFLSFLISLQSFFFRICLDPKLTSLHF